MNMFNQLGNPLNKEPYCEFLRILRNTKTENLNGLNITLPITKGNGEKKKENNEIYKISFCDYVKKEPINKSNYLLIIEYEKTIPENMFDTGYRILDNILEHKENIYISDCFGVKLQGELRKKKQVKLQLTGIVPKKDYIKGSLSLINQMENYRISYNLIAT
ncbi:MAG: hypothetical protein ACI4F4_04650 [Lachnospiraceae bacterium]